MAFVNSIPELKTSVLESYAPNLLIAIDSSIPVTLDVTLSFPVLESICVYARLVKYLS